MCSEHDVSAAAGRKSRLAYKFPTKMFVYSFISVLFYTPLNRYRFIFSNSYISYRFIWGGVHFRTPGIKVIFRISLNAVAAVAQSTVQIVHILGR